MTDKDTHDNRIRLINNKRLKIFVYNIRHFFQRALTAHHNLLTLPAFTVWLCRVFITSLVTEILLSTYQFPTMKRGCFLWAEGSITSRLMTGHVPDCRQAPCTCFNCVFFLYASYSFQRADETTDPNICLISLRRAPMFFFYFCIWMQRRSCVISICRWNAVPCSLKAGGNKWQRDSPPDSNSPAFQSSLYTKMSALPAWRSKQHNKTRVGL